MCDRFTNSNAAFINRLKPNRSTFVTCRELCPVDNIAGSIPCLLQKNVGHRSIGLVSPVHRANKGSPDAGHRLFSKHGNSGPPTHKTPNPTSMCNKVFEVTSKDRINRKLRKV